MTERFDREQRQAAARAEYEHIMTTPSPDPTGSFVEAGVIGFVFGEMWRRGVLTPRDRRWITLSCLGADDTALPIESHVWAALNSGDITFEEFDEFVLQFATQLGWPKGSVLNMYGAKGMSALAEQRDEQLRALDFEPWAEPADDSTRRVRGEAAYLDVHGVAAPPAVTAFRGRSYLDYLYGEIWTRQRYLTRRDRRIISICCCAVVGADVETAQHLRSALTSGDMTQAELEELVMHYAVYVGWALGRHLDDLLIDVADER
jgi:4-carboxymuconolactone decarboxylase